MQMCGVTAGSTAACGAGAAQPLDEAREIVGQRVEPAVAHEALALVDVGMDDHQSGTTPRALQAAVIFS